MMNRYALAAAALLLLLAPPFAVAGKTKKGAKISGAQTAHISGAAGTAEQPLHASGAQTAAPAKTQILTQRVDGGQAVFGVQRRPRAPEGASVRPPRSPRPARAPGAAIDE